MIKGHGDDTYKYSNIRLNFSSNVYSHFNHEGLFAYLASRLSKVESYPEPVPMSLEKELAIELGLKEENVCVTNGATEAIYLIAQAFRHNKTAILMPTFSEYKDACTLHEHTLYPIYSLQQIPQQAEMVWLCNPNNPTGTVLPKDDLIRTFGNHPKTVFVVDASYAPFTEKAVVISNEAAEMPNVLMLHSMTKEFSIPGLRLGYITGDEQLLTQIRLQRMPWSVNQLAIDAGHYALRHPEEFQFDLHALMQERQRVAECLTRLGCIDVWPSDTHILLCRLRFGNSADLKDFLAVEKGILIRDASNFDALGPDFFRIAIQTAKENDELIKAIEEWICM